MASFIEKLDDLAAINSESRAAAWLDRIAFGFLCLMVTAAPHSIAGTQTAWLAGMLFFFARMFFKPRISLKTGWLGIALIALFAWTVLSSVLSYAPDISIDKLRGAGLFLIFFFVIGVVRSFRAVYFLVFLLIGSCLFNVLLMPIQRVIGRGIEIQTLQPESVLAKAGIGPADVILEVDGKKVVSPGEIAAALRIKESVSIKYQHVEFYQDAIINRAEAAAGEIEDGTLGIGEWKRSRSWRSAGFYGHYTTYAEVLQLIGSLLFGLFVAGFLSSKQSGLIETFSSYPAKLNNSLFRFAATGLFCAFCLGAYCLALLLTVTRAPQLAFLISGFVILLIGASRKWIIAALVIAIPLAVIGLFVLQRSREVGFFDPNDNSTNYRMMIWREGADLWTRNPHNFILGVGMDTVKRYACEWGLFDNCRQPILHYHSTPLQLLVERGLPALLMWLTVLAIYARSLWRSIRDPNDEGSEWREGRILPDRSPTLNRGIWLGCLGGLIGFFVSGIVHYNYGDGEVVMVFYLLMGLATKLTLLSKAETA